MTEQEVKEFINKVTGKKIRLNQWPDSKYFIPNGNYEMNEFYGTDNDGEEDFWYMYNGFESDKSGYCWEFVDKEEIGIGLPGYKSLDEKPKEKHKCMCDFFKTIMVTGCQCGGI